MYVCCLIHSFFCCSVLRCVEVSCSELQCVATKVASCAYVCCFVRSSFCCSVKLQHSAALCNKPCNTHCNTLQHAATLCNTLQYTAAGAWVEGCQCNSARLWNILEHSAAHCNTPQPARGIGGGTLLLHMATHCDTLLHTATHCSTLQHTADGAWDGRVYTTVSKHRSLCVHVRACVRVCVCVFVSECLFLCANVIKQLSLCLCV